MLEVRLLGKFEVNYDGKPFIITARPAQSLFAYLILNAGTAHRREKLAGMLWPDSSEETARDNLRHALWRLRKAFPDGLASEYLLADDLSIAFNAAADYWLDASALDHLSETSSANELIVVLSEYRGELLPGFYEEWVVLERDHLTSVFEHHMARLLSMLQAEKRWLEVLEWGERWIKLGQKPEPAYQALMSAHAAKGDMSKVAGTYERCIKSLQEYGIEPSEQTRALFARLKAVKGYLEPDLAVPTYEKRKEAPRSNIPVPLTSFIGREKEIDRVVKSMSKKRLITLTGPGGVGKTRLAIQASNILLNEFRDGVWWVDLVGLKDDSLVLQALAQTADVREVPNQPLLETLIEYVRTKQVLLVLDNCEHLIDSCARLTDRLLSACPGLKIMVTSREMLGLIGEEICHVPALSIPEPGSIPQPEALGQYESVFMFVERAEAVSPGFKLTGRNALSVIQICQRLDGIPLAIELAAARVKLLPVEKIAARLDARFDLLTGGSRTAFPRHQTLRAAIDWSYDLLPAKEKKLFARLAVFSGSWKLDEAQAICSSADISPEEVLDLLANLVAKSLVTVERPEGEARFHMLETLREYALKKLPETGEVQSRHLEFYRQMAEEIEPRLHSAEQAFWLNRLEAVHENLRAALDWSLTGGDLESGLKLAGALWLFWDIRGYHLEARVWLDRLLTQSQNRVPEPGASALVRALYVSGHLRQRQGEYEQARKEYTASLSIYRQMGEERQVAVVLRGLGEIAQDEGDPSSARLYYEQSLELCRSLGDFKGMSIALSHLAILAFLQGDYEQAAMLCIETLAIGRERGSRRTTAVALTTLGFAAWGKGELGFAEAQFEEALALQAELTDQMVAQYSLMGFALVASARGQYARAGRLFGAADSLRERIGTPLPHSQRHRYELLVASIRAALGEVAFREIWEEGRAMTLEQAIEYALAANT